jgi:hypothetical protein
LSRKIIRRISGRLGTTLRTDPEAKKNGTPASPATALANIVLPVPGEPVSRIPFGSLPPREAKVVGSLRNCTTSCSSYNDFGLHIRIEFRQRKLLAYILGFIDAVNIGEFDGFTLHWFELSQSRASLQKARTFGQHSKDENKDYPDSMNISRSDWTKGH